MLAPASASIPSIDASATPAQLRRFFYAAYCDTPTPLRWLSAIRPYVCPYDKLLQFVRDGADMLDVGCGAGSLLAVLAATKKIRRGVGCDVMAPPLESARAAAQRLGAQDMLTFEHIRSVAHAPEGPFDIVAMIDVLHHVPPPDRRDVFAAAVHRVRPGGIFLYKDMTARPGGRRLAHNIDDYVFTREWVEQVPEGAVEAWARDHQLALVHDEFIPRLIYGHELRVFQRLEH
ncbi:cyclopropane-fatty-acyl-phospholipid synthase family protein [Caballeronia sp. NK8]|uniref:SAM-dependent methyltransferase n=1 Tax=Caballeronia sp. NK8 TaxID=140098 RepID=UPI001BCC91FA|nr:class I SAM-dependent methyltransferase [Caballeronia sp. NK8]